MAGERNLPGLGLEAFFNIGSNGWKDAYDLNWLTASVMCQLAPISRTDALPGTPSQGDIYIVKDDDPTHANDVAVYDDAQWKYLSALKGMIAIVKDENVAVWYNGTIWTSIASGIDTPYDVGGSYNGVPAADVVLLRYPFVREVSFPADMLLSRAVAGTGATASTVFSLKKNGTQFGTMTFAAAGTVATFASASTTTFVAGDILTVVAPTVPDATLSDLGFALAGRRVI